MRKSPRKKRVTLRRSSVFRVCRRAILRGALAALASTAIPAAGLATEPVGEFIETLGEKAVGMLTVDGIARQEREQRFRELLHEYFDVNRITRFALGKYARRIGEDEMARFAILFEDLAVLNYAHLFAAYSGQGFRVLRVTGAPGDRYRIVATEIQTPDGGAAIRLDWQVFTRGDSHAVVDIRVEGISMAIAQRDEFTSFLNNNNGDIEVFLAALSERVAALRERNRKD